MTGWAWPLNSRKAHFFADDRRSLCGKWMFMGDPTKSQGMGDEPGPDDCKPCFRKRKKQIDEIEDAP